MKIYKILPNRYYGGEIEVPDGTLGIPKGTTRTAPPFIPPGMTAIWNGKGWDITRFPSPMSNPTPVIEQPTIEEYDPTLVETPSETTGNTEPE